MTKIVAPQRLPDWLLGGRVRRRILEKLAEERGWAALELAAEVGAGEATTFEVFRVLREPPVDALELTSSAREGCYRLKKEGNQVAEAVRALVAASNAIGEEPIPRPPSREGRTD